MKKAIRKIYDYTSYIADSRNNMKYLKYVLGPKFCRLKLESRKANVAIDTEVSWVSVVSAIPFSFLSVDFQRNRFMTQ